MHFVDKVFSRWEKKRLFKAMWAILLVGLVLLLPALLKLVFPAPRANSTSGTFGPIWGRFIFAHLLFLVQAFFFFKHPICRQMARSGGYAAGFLLLYLLGCLLSPWLTGCYRSFQELIKLFSASSLFFLFLYYSYKVSSLHILRACAYIGCYLMTAEALLGLGQYALQSDFGLKWLGEKVLDPLGHAASVRLIEGIRWTFDAGSNAMLILRPYGTFDHPNHFGGFLVIGFLLTCHLLANHARTRIAKNIFTLALTIQAMALTATYSRSAWLGGVLGLAIFLGMRLRRCRGFWEKEKTLLIALSIAICTSLFVFHSQIYQRCFPKAIASKETAAATPIQYLFEHDIGERGRFQGISQRMISQYPWHGVGFQEFVRQLPLFDTTKSQLLPVHNIYLLVAAELGLPTAAAFILFVIFITWRAIRNSKWEVLAAFWLTIAVIGFMDNYFLTSQAGRFLFFAAAALVLLKYECGTENANC